MRCLILCCMLLTTTSVLDVSADDSAMKEKYVSASLYSKWSETPLLLEAVEFIHRNNPNFLWTFIQEVSNMPIFSDTNSMNNLTYYNEVLRKASEVLSNMQFDLLKLSLSIRTYSPAIEMSRKLAEEINPSESCLTFVDVHGQISCDPADIAKLVTSADVTSKPLLFQFDKQYLAELPKQKSTTKVAVVLYGLIGSADFTRFHETILALKNLPYSIEYIFRHNYMPSHSAEANRVALSGYGVELDIKNLEYKNKDDAKVKQDDESDTKESRESKDDSMNGFLFGKLKERNPDMKENLDELKKYLLESTMDLAPLKPWQTQDLSLQAAQRVLEADPADALTVLEDLSQNFPMRARSLSKVQVKSELKKVWKRQRSRFESAFNMEPGTGAMFLNGLQVPTESTDIFSLSAMLRKEAKLVESLHQTGLTLDQIKALVHLDTTTKNTQYGVDIRDSSIQWLNNLEKDKKYQHWPRNLQEILRPTYPGMTRTIARNFYNLVFLVDPAQLESQALLKVAESFYVNDVPIRIGFVFVTNNEMQTDGFKHANVALFRAHNYIKSTQRSSYKALAFITDVYANAPKNKELSADWVVKMFKKKYPNEKNVDDVFGPDSDYDEGRLLTMEYYRKIGLRKLPQALLNGYPLAAAELEDDSFEDAVITKIMHLTQDIQMAVYKGELQDSMDLLDWLMDREEIMPRLNPRILSTERQFLSVNEFIEDMEQFVYFRTQKADVNPLTLWQVSDPDTEKGRQLLLDSVSFYQTSKISTRLAVFLQRSINSEDLFKRAVGYAIVNLKDSQGAKFISRCMRENNYLALKNKKKQFSEVLKESTGLEVANLDQLIADFDLDKLLEIHKKFLSEHTPFKRDDDIGLVANGWVLGPLEENEVFIDSDFALMERFIIKLGLKSIKSLVTKWELENANDKILMISCLLGKFGSNEKRVNVPVFSEGVVRVKPRKNNLPFYDIVVILDPLTRQAQQMSTVLKMLTRVTNVNLVIYFNSKDKLSGPPLNNFYRYVLEEEVKFGQDGAQMQKPNALFHNMPQSSVLTMNMYPPESWMFECVKSPYDLDNIMLTEVDGDGVNGEFELEHIVVEGHAFDILSGQSPRGLQFNLGTQSNPTMYDTIVMANLGYFQLKSSPGIWYLKLREGRSKDIYEIVSHENTESESKRSQNIVIVVDSFEGKIIKIKVSKKADKIGENLLDDGKDDGQQDEGIWGSIKSSFGGSNDENALAEAKDKNNVLNIFSLASGHLYERLMRIMMLTVLKNTEAKVKFWFLKNYLSPQFTKFLPYYSEKYGFDYELVQYKWPRWLHQQTEKQRIIWGYKILFLDVLFPLNVEKIIYVDADQIVKADLTELRDINLKGAPYGYTPFCDSKKEMDGFRFWKTGYWQMHLAHRKYHISALYVVDLKKFRKIAAGDRLRGQYQGLSQDPNSLSNLDQDLPNNMIHQVNIFSLPQEWLYCDTWCSASTLKNAKTIDLCNNPQTKEPKLEQAKRIVPEWTDYDNEIKRVMEQWKGEQKGSKTVTSTTTPAPRTKAAHTEDL